MGVNCSICGRTLDQENNPLSDDCGGDCWECIGEIEADMGDEYALKQLRKEFKILDKSLSGLKKKKLFNHRKTHIGDIEGVLN